MTQKSWLGEEKRSFPFLFSFFLPIIPARPPHWFPAHPNFAPRSSLFNAGKACGESQLHVASICFKILTTRKRVQER